MQKRYSRNIIIKESKDYISKYSDRKGEKDMKIIAFHLPQYHTIPENDKWWGKGFTEWTNVKRGKQYFKGHYQPREPLNDNYYDLSDGKTIEQQMQLAKKYGVYGFCFYHYYFAGKKLLEKPLEQLLENKAADLPFCFAWANESWKRTWYRNSGSKKMLQMQIYGSENEWTNHFMYLLKFFKDERYIKIDGRPVFLIYRSKDIKRRRDMANLWRKLAIENGFPGVYLITMDTGWEKDTFRKCFDATVEFEPIKTLNSLSTLEKFFRDSKRVFLSKTGLVKINMLKKFFLNIYSYDRINRLMINRKYSNKEKIFLGAFPGWDNSSRKDEDALVLKGSSPDKFEKFLNEQIEKSRKIDSEFIFVNAWNEWSEGAYLEPDKKYGYTYLKALKRSVENNANSGSI